MKELAFIQNLSSWEIILIFLVVLLFFGAKRLPELFRSFGKSVKEFKKATTDIEEDIRTAMEDTPTEKAQAPIQPSSEASAVDSTATASLDSEPAETAEAAVESREEEEEKNQS